VPAEHGADVALGEGVPAGGRIGLLALVDLLALDDGRLEVLEGVAEVEVRDGDLVELAADGSAGELGGVQVGVEGVGCGPWSCRAAW
jgi:hypothetical protein